MVELNQLTARYSGSLGVPVRKAARVLLWLVIAALELAAAMAICVSAYAALARHRQGPAPGEISITGPAAPPQLVFACEQDPAQLQGLFGNPDVMGALQRLHAGVALSLGDLSASRAEVVKRLNEAGIPVTISLTLPQEQGYYLNASNAPQAAERFTAFQKWAGDAGLRVARIGLDIEPTLQEFNRALQGHWLGVAGSLLRRCFDGGAVTRARREYAALIARIQHAGYPVETYQFPFLADERKVHVTVLDRLFGIVDVRGDREALMTYTSFNHALDSALIAQYGPDAQVVVVGVTTGDPASTGRFRPLDWDELSRDLIVGSHFSPVIGIYSLEGCVRQGFLPRLESMDWHRTVTIPAEADRNAIALRARIQGVLWTAAHIAYLIGAVLALNLWLLWRRRARQTRAA